MAIEQQRLTPEERANLVAYLDGELSEPEAGQIAAKLTQSVTARREVEALERTWQLLEHLPRPQASEELASRTLTEVDRLARLQGEPILGVGQAAGPLARGVLWVVASALAFGLGFGAIRWAWPDPTGRLARDLSIAEHLDEYRDVGSFEFLEQLEQSPLFVRPHD